MKKQSELINKVKKWNLTMMQIEFCEAYVSREFFGNGVEAWAESHNIDLTKPGAYAGARASASRALTRANILKYINSLLDAEGFNNEFVDKQLLLAMTQNADLGAKVAAIREYNKLKKRIEDKLELRIARFDVKFNEEEKPQLNDGNNLP